MTLDLPRLLLGLGFCLGLAFAAAGTSAGCSSSSGSNVAVPVVNDACPATLDATVGAVCSSPGMVCGPTFLCGLATFTIRCTCEEGTFQCIDGSGKAFAAGSTPSCGEAGPAPAPCPATENAAMTTASACSQAEDEQQCSYVPMCPGGTLAFDLCTCQPVPDGSGFAYDCENACHSGNEPLPEAGTSPEGLDGSADAHAVDSSRDGAGDGAGDGAVEGGDGGLEGDVAAE